MTDPEAVSRQALELLGRNPAAAATLARQALQAAPGHGQATVVLAAALRQQGDYEGALSVVEPQAVGESAAWPALYELALALFALGRTREAAAPLQAAAARNPGLAPGWRRLGDLALVGGDPGAAQAAYDRQARAMFRHPSLSAAADALIEGRTDETEQRAKAMLASPDLAPPALLLLGEALGRKGRLDEAQACFEQALARVGDFVIAREALAAVLFRKGRFDAVLAELERALARDHGNVRCRTMKAAALSELGDYAGAAEVTRGLLDAFPDQPHAWLVYGNGLRTVGRTAEAIEAYHRCLELDPGSTEAFWSLSNLKIYRFTAEQRAAMEALLAEPGLGAEPRANLLFALAKAEDDEGRFAEAFARYTEGNALQRIKRPYDPDQTRDYVRRCRTVFTRAFFEARRGWGAKAPDPIFVVGLPRSGSTLVEQILASHPEVEGLRELQEIGAIVKWIEGPPTPGAPPGYPDQLPQMPRKAAAQFGGDYLDWTRAYRRLGRPRFVDKAPWNFQHLGLIQLILPNAKIVDVRRHPLACCVSAFRQHFSEGWDFAFDLEDLGRYYADYVELMAHFDEVLPGRVHRVIYEDLVAETEGEVRRLLDYLGLPFDAACLRFFENPRAVATPSSEQVRRPITTDAVDQWKRYEAWLDPLKAALGPALDAYPTAP
jgi:tetratricopeptide (TPR) repeat protein